MPDPVQTEPDADPLPDTMGVITIGVIAGLILEWITVRRLN